MTITDSSVRSAMPGRVDRLLVHLDPPLPRLQLNLLLRSGCLSVDEVDALSDTELQMIPGLGTASVAIIRDRLASADARPPSDGHMPIDKLDARLPQQLRGLLAEVGFRTVEEVAGSNQKVMSELVSTARRRIGLGPLYPPTREVRTIQTAALTAAADKYMAGTKTTFHPGQVRELIALLGHLALYVDADADAVLARRTRAFIQRIAPGFPAPWNPARPRLASSSDADTTAV